MNATKTCPTCRRELPAAAIRCSHCGFRFGDGDAVQKMTMPMRTVPKSEAATDAAKPEAAEVAPSPERPGRSRTMLGFAPPIADRPSLKPDPFAGVSTARASVPPARGSMPPPRTSVPPASPGTRPERRNTLPPAPKPGQKSASPGSSAPPPPPPSPPVNTPAVHVDASGDWIPEVDEISQLISLDADTTTGTPQIAAPDAAPAQPAVSKALEKARATIEGLKERTGPVLTRLGQQIAALYRQMSPHVVRIARIPVVPFALMTRIDRKPQIPRTVRDIIAGVRVWHVAAALLAIVIIIAVASSGKDDDPPSDAPARADEGHDGDASSANDAPATDPGPSTAVKGESKPAAGCHPLEAYPDFRWKDELGGLLSAMKKRGICQLMGMSRARISAALEKKTVMDSDGLDGLAGGSLVEWLPDGVDGFPAPRIAFLFHDNSLFRIVLDYQQTRGVAFDVDALSTATEREAEQLRDRADRRVTRLADSDLLVEWVEGRSREDGRMLMFSSAARVDAIRDALDARDAAVRLSDNGRRLMRDGRFEEAEKQFVEALQVNPETAFAYVDLARTQLPRGDFKSAAQNARLALRNSADRHVLAAAGDILAVCALFEGDTAKAIGYLRKSASGDPTMPRYDQAARELEDQRWETARVALTAARMSCLDHGTDAAAIVLARGNFPSTDAFFAAMETAKTDMQFEHLKALYIKEECR